MKKSMRLLTQIQENPKSCLRVSELHQKKQLKFTSSTKPSLSLLLRQQPLSSIGINYKKSGKSILYRQSKMSNYPKTLFQRQTQRDIQPQVQKAIEITHRVQMRRQVNNLTQFTRICQAKSNFLYSRINKEINQKKRQNVLSQLKEMYHINEDTNKKLYLYAKVQASMQSLNALARILSSPTLIYHTFSFTACCLFEYGSYSLSLFYFDKALKTFFDRTTPINHEERKLEMEVYYHVAKLFLIKNQLAQAKGFAIEFLRRAWIMADVDAEMEAYDMLGKIYLELDDFSLGTYFHNRMKRYREEDKALMRMSRLSIEKVEKENAVDYVYYETINMFTDRHGYFSEALINIYRLQVESKYKDTTAAVLKTHRSHNRVLANHRVLERKMVSEKNSCELHFLQKKHVKQLKKIFSAFSMMLHQVIRKQEHITYKIQTNESID